MFEPLDPDENMPIFDVAMNMEYDVWQLSNEELKHIGFEDGWNNPALKGVHEVITLWGECLVGLRFHQEGGYEAHIASFSEKLAKVNERVAKLKDE